MKLVFEVPRQISDLGSSAPRTILGICDNSHIPSSGREASDADDLAGALSFCLLVDEMSGNHVLHGASHGLVDRDLGRGDAAGTPAGQHVAERDTLLWIEPRQLAATNRR